MIQELRTLLINDVSASPVVLTPSEFVGVRLSQIESKIRMAILGSSNSSIEYRCFVADRLVNAIYRDSEFEVLLKQIFDKRVCINNIEPDGFILPRYSVETSESPILVDVTRVLDKNKKQSVITYTLSKNPSDESGKSILITGGASGKDQIVSLSNSELITSSGWIELDSSGVFIKVSLPGQIVQEFDGGDAIQALITGVLDGGSSYTQEFDSIDGVATVKDTYSATITIEMPFTFWAGQVLNEILSIQGVIDFMYLIGSEYPEILQKFNSNHRKDRQLFSIIVAYGISAKKKL